MNLYHKKQLGISWIQGEFKATLVQEGVTQTYYQASVHTLSQLYIALGLAIPELGAEDADVSMVYEGSELSHHFIQTPPLSHRDLLLYIANRAEQEKIADVPVLHSFKRSLPQQSGDGVILHIINKTFVDELITICQHHHIAITKLIPLSEIMSLEAFRFSTNNNDMILMVAMFGTITEIMATRGDGKVLFLRDLNHNIEHDSTDRLIGEINRSMLYANQQFDVDITQISLIGSAPTNITETLQQHFTLPVENTQSDNPYFWANEAALLSPAVEGNMLPIQFQFERVGMHIKRMLTITVAIAFLIGVGLTINIEYQVTKAEAHAKSQRSGLTGLIMEQGRLSQQVAAMENIDKRIHELQNTQVYPIAGWFLAELPALLPESLVLTDSLIHYANQQWHFTLQGKALGKASLAPQQLNTLENNLKALPLTVNITQSWQDTWFYHIQKGGHGTQGTAFEIQGTMQ
ncbi:MAG: hypothetical protein Q9M46_05465 [Ghiorsea sp.]|nr:hypothetical protein [Ghiorsea sp.]